MFATLLTIFFRGPLIVLATIVMGTCSIIVSWFDPEGVRQLRCASIWAKMLCLIMGIRVKMVGLEKLDTTRNYIFVANHLSYADTPVLLAHIPANFRFLARAQLFNIPFLGHHLRAAGHIPVETENPRDAIRSMNEAGKTVRERAISVLIFPEGGRSHGKFGEFKGGAAFVAIRSGVPVVPLGLIGTREILPRNGRGIHPGQVTVMVGEPVNTEGLASKDREALSQLLHSKVAELIKGHYGV